MALWIVSGSIMVVAVSVGLLTRRHSRLHPPVESLGEGLIARRWGIAFVLLLGESAGVAASLYLTEAVLDPGQNIIVLSVVIATANLGGALAARPADSPLSPQELFLTFKDGLLWPAALPSIAATLDMSMRN